MMSEGSFTENWIKERLLALLINEEKDMNSINKVILIGFVGKSPEIRFTQTGLSIVTFSVATTESWKNKAGEWDKKTEWHNVVVMNKLLCDVASKHLKKGSKVYIEGQIQTNKYTDKAGKEIQNTQILVPQFKGALMVLDSKEDYSNSSSSLKKTNTEEPLTFLDDEIPFG